MAPVRSIPNRFEDYLRTRRGGLEHEGERCTGCLEGPPITRDGYCVECVREQFGFDRAEEHVATAILAGAIRGALEAGVSSEMIALAAHRATVAYHEANEDSMFRALGRS